MLNVPLPTPPSSPTPPTPAGSSPSTGSGAGSPPSQPVMPPSKPPLPPGGSPMPSTLPKPTTSPVPPTPPPPGVSRPTPSLPGTSLSSSAPNMPPGLPRPPAPGGVPGAGQPIPGSQTPGSGKPPEPTKPAVGAAAGGKSPQMATAKKSFLRFLPFIVGGIALLAVIGFVLSRVLGGGSTPSGASPAPAVGQGEVRQTVPSQQTTLTYWGLWEPNTVLDQAFKQFEQDNPGVTIEYTQHSPKDYRERLQTAIASGSGPDLFRFHASWTPMLRNELSAIPANIYSASEFNSTFYPAAATQLQLNGQLMGIPLMYEGLALYYNKEMLQSADAQPPTTWAELRTLANRLTIRSGDVIQRGGLAVGNANNVEHFSDIIGLLMLQNGADPTKPTSPEARDALLFYTNFVKTDKVWSEALPNSTTAFARGDVAMMFAPSWRAHEIKTQNPNLNFGIAPVPKLGEDKVAWATFWAEGVNTQSKSKDMSWKLLKYLSSAEVQQKLYSDQSSVRSFGEIYSRQDLANQLAGQELVAPYLSDAPEAKGWYLSSFTHDNGINDQLIKYYQDAVNAVLSGKSIDEVLLTIDQGTKQVLRQYGVVLPAASTAPTTGG